MEKFSIVTKVVGVQYSMCDYDIHDLNPGDRLFLIREPDNTVDPNAIAVKDSKDNKLGYISRPLAERLAPKIDSGYILVAIVKNITGNEKIGFGLDIQINSTSDT